MQKMDMECEERRRVQMHRILDLVLDINGLGRRQQELTGNLPTAFMHFSGHISNVDIDIHRNGWRTDYADEERENKTAYLDCDSEMDEMIRWLMGIKK